MSNADALRALADALYDARPFIVSLDIEWLVEQIDAALALLPAEDRAPTCTECLHPIANHGMRGCGNRHCSCPVDPTPDEPASPAREGAQTT